MSSHPIRPAQAGRPRTCDAARYQRVTLANMTMAVIMGYRPVQAVFVVNLGRLGDILGRVRIYNLGFVVFTVASILLSLDPFTGSHAALWPIDELDRQPGDHLITTRRRSAFHDTGLDNLLRALGVTQVVLAGVSTHEHGYHVVLATDAMAGPDPESHRHSLERIFPKLGETGRTRPTVARRRSHARKSPRRRTAQPARRPARPGLGPPRPADPGELHPDQPGLRP